MAPQAVFHIGCEDDSKVIKVSMMNKNRMWAAG